MDEIFTQQEYYDINLLKNTDDFKVGKNESQIPITMMEINNNVGVLKNIGEYKTNPNNIILCIYSSVSYDDMYRKVESSDDNKINIYSVGYETIDNFYDIIINKKSTINESYVNLMDDLEKVKPENVMIYFECCSYFESVGYKFTNNCIKLIEYFIFNKKYLILCADFSLKALINSWDVELFGPNPMTRCADITEQQIEIEFEKDKFTSSGLKQLQVISGLVDSDNNKGEISLHVLDKTISYKLNRENDDKYEINILSIVKKEEKKYDSLDLNNNEHILKKRTLSNNDYVVTKKEENILNNFIGQAIINFKEGGKIFASNGHFSELCNINCSKKTLLKSIEQILGKDYYDNFINNMNNCDNDNDDDDLQVLKSASLQSLMSQPLTQT